MPELVQTALLGTSRQAAAELSVPDELAGLLGGLPELPLEARLLLLAGAASLADRAGAVTQAARAAPQPAPPDQLPAPSALVADRLGRVLRDPGMHGLLEPLLARLQRAGLRLPPQLLPAALDLDARWHGLVWPVLGARGRWLAGLRPAWAWAVSDAAPAAAPEGLQQRWTEGLPAERQALLEQLRAVAPDQARELLAATWLQDKAAVRLKLLSALEIGLSPADQSFLEGLLRDRSQAVRQQASELLLRLPGSALARQACAEAAACVRWQDGQAVWQPPRQHSPALASLQVPEQARAGWGRRAWWLAELLRRVPPGFWTQSSGQPAVALVAQARCAELAGALLYGFSHAALAFDAHDWFEPLFVACWCFEPARPPIQARFLAGQLFAAMPVERADAQLQRVLRDDVHAAMALVEQLPGPWTAALSAQLLQLWRGLSADLARGSVLRRDERVALDSWCQAAACAAPRLAGELRAASLSGWQLPEGGARQLGRFREALEGFLQQTEILKTLEREIPL